MKTFDINFKNFLSGRLTYINGVLQVVNILPLCVLKEVKSTLKEKELHWIILDFFSLSKRIDSPSLRFLDASWNLQIDASKTNSTDHIDLHVKINDVDTKPYNVLCTFGIMKADCSLIKVSSFHHTFTQQKPVLFAWNFFTRSALLKRKSELMPSNKLIIKCNLKQLADPVKLIGNLKFILGTNIYFSKVIKNTLREINYF